MKLLDTNVLVYARNPKSPFYQWAVGQIMQLAKLDGEGAGFSAISVAELCAEDGVVPTDVPAAIESFGIEILDWPQAAAPRCGKPIGRTGATGREAQTRTLPKCLSPISSSARTLNGSALTS
jgi:hypothetical protein